MLTFTVHQQTATETNNIQPLRKQSEHETLHNTITRPLKKNIQYLQYNKNKLGSFTKLQQKRG